MVHDHSLAIGALRTDCTALVWPDAQPALRGLLDRVTGTRLPVALSRALEPLLDDLDGVVRVRDLQLDVDFLGRFDEAALTHVLAVRIASALRDALCTQETDVVRHWPDQGAYIAAYIEHRLALSVDPVPSWAFEEFTVLEHLPPERAVAELIQKCPEVLISLAKTATAETDPARIARALDETSARALVDALLDPALPSAMPGELTEIFQLVDQQLRQLAINEPARAVLSLTMIQLARTARSAVSKTVAVTTQAIALLHLFSNKDGFHAGRSQIRKPADLPAAVTRRLSRKVLALVEKQLGETAFRQRVEEILPIEPTFERPVTRTDKVSDNCNTEAIPDQLYSPFAGIGLLLPVIADLCLQEHLNPRQLHDVLLSVLGTDQQLVAVTDPFFASLFPFERQHTDQSFPPIPAALKDRLAPETLPLRSGNGVDSWGEFVLAAFATRLPGLNASSREYLQKQFLHTPGYLIFGEETIKLTLQGPDLAIVLKMAGFSGVQRKLPQLGNRLLIITLAGFVQ